MRNELVGNVADFFKYGLLRTLTRVSDYGKSLRLGVVWFLDSYSGQKSKGSGWDYLGDQTGAFNQCDLALFQKMQAFADRNYRDVENVASWEILPEETLFFAKPLPTLQNAEVTDDEPTSARQIWLRAALDRMGKAQIVFLDPNRGLEIGGSNSTTKRSNDYCAYSELTEFWTAGKSLVLFQSRRRTLAQDQISQQLSDIKAHLHDTSFIEPLYFQSEHGFLFFVIAQPSHIEFLRLRLDGMRDKWQPHLRRVA